MFAMGKNVFCDDIIGNNKFILLNIPALTSSSYVKTIEGCFVDEYLGNGTGQGTCGSGYVCHTNGECRPRDSYEHV